LLYSDHVSSLNTEPVTSIAANNIGKIKGNNNIGRSVSLTPVFEVIDPIIVPITDIPKVANIATIIIEVCIRFKLKMIENIGKINISKIIINKKRVVTFPRNKISLDIGRSNNDSKLPLSVSLDKNLFKPRTAVKKIVTHNIPGRTRIYDSIDTSIDILNITTQVNEKIVVSIINSFLCNSTLISFADIYQIYKKYFFIIHFR
tara:strand:- start:3420 stop:4028 length:609 start_codon:yes stop_codon:yes gene_type:complete